MWELLQRAPAWVLGLLTISAIALLAFGVATGRQVSLWPPSVGPAGSAEPCPSFADLANGSLKAMAIK
jgi:hypothetical protein